MIKYIAHEDDVLELSLDADQILIEGTGFDAKLIFMGIVKIETDNKGDFSISR